jgi:hypothetical protein
MCITSCQSPLADSPWVRSSHALVGPAQRAKFRTRPTGSSTRLPMPTSRRRQTLGQQSPTPTLPPPKRAPAAPFGGRTANAMAERTTLSSRTASLLVPMRLPYCLRVLRVEEEYRRTYAASMRRQAACTGITRCLTVRNYASLGHFESAPTKSTTRRIGSSANAKVLPVQVAPPAPAVLVAPAAALPEDKHLIRGALIKKASASLRGRPRAERVWKMLPVPTPSAASIDLVVLAVRLSTDVGPTSFCPRSVRCQSTSRR